MRTIGVIAFACLAITALVVQQEAIATRNATIQQLKAQLLERAKIVTFYREMHAPK